MEETLLLYLPWIVVNTAVVAASCYAWLARAIDPTPESRAQV